MKYRSELSDEACEAEFQLLSKEIVFDAVRGTSHWREDAQPTMIVWAGRIFDFLRVLEGVVGHLPARRHSYEVGFRSGWDGADVIAAHVKARDPEEAKVAVLLAGNRILVGAGWGRATIEYDSESGEVVWEFPKGTAVGQAALAHGTRDRPACPFLAGFVAGWTERAIGGHAEFKETACVAQGRPHCRFESREFIRFRA